MMMNISQQGSVISTADIPGHLIVPNAFPFISGLRALNMHAVVDSQSNALGLIPRERTTDQLLRVARENKELIIAEVMRLAELADPDPWASGTSATGSGQGAPREALPDIRKSQWFDARHDLDAVSDLLCKLMAYISTLPGWTAGQLWGDTGHDAKPGARPYAYLKTEFVNNRPTYYVMLADTDGNDYVWAAVEQFDFEAFKRA